MSPLKLFNTNAEPQFSKTFFWKWDDVPVIVCLKCVSVGGRVIDGWRFLINSPPSFSFHSMARLCTRSLVYHTRMHTHASANLHIQCMHKHARGLYAYYKHTSYKVRAILILQRCTFAHTNTHNELCVCLYMDIFFSASKEARPGNDWVSFCVREKGNGR